MIELTFCVPTTPGPQPLELPRQWAYAITIKWFGRFASCDLMLAVCHATGYAGDVNLGTTDIQRREQQGLLLVDLRGSVWCASRLSQQGQCMRLETFDDVAALLVQPTPHALLSIGKRLPAEGF